MMFDLILGLIGITFIVIDTPLSNGLAIVILLLFIFKSAVNGDTKERRDE
jgi:hypothetical protein